MRGGRACAREGGDEVGRGRRRGVRGVEPGRGVPCEVQGDKTTVPK